MTKTNLKQQIFIDALASKVWKVLTGCDYINQYLFDGSVHCQWKEGSSILVTDTERETQTASKGKVLHVVPGVLLKYNLEENPESLITVTYELNLAEDGIELKFSSEGYNDSDEAYFFRLQQTKLLLQKIKWLAEYA